MKKFIVLFVVGLLFMSCSEEFYTNGKSFSPEGLYDVSPPELVYVKKVAKNWWEGTYEGRKVLIHAVVTHYYVNVEFQFVDKE